MGQLYSPNFLYLILKEKVIWQYETFLVKHDRDDKIIEEFVLCMYVTI